MASSAMAKASAPEQRTAGMPAQGAAGVAAQRTSSAPAQGAAGVAAQRTAGAPAQRTAKDAESPGAAALGLYEASPDCPTAREADALQRLGARFALRPCRMPTSEPCGARTLNVDLKQGGAGGAKSDVASSSCGTGTAPEASGEGAVHGSGGVRSGRACDARRADAARPRAAIFRSRALCDADAHDVQALCDLGITDVFDLRKPAERKERPLPDLVTSTFALHQRALGTSQGSSRTPDSVACDVRKAYGRPGERMMRQYERLAQQGARIDLISKEVLLACERGCVLLHCANGKDRTGVVCASLQRALGVPEAVVMADYLATNEYNRAKNAHDLAREALYRSPEELEVLRAMYEARPEYLRAYFGERHRLKMLKAASTWGKGRA